MGLTAERVARRKLFTIQKSLTLWLVNACYLSAPKEDLKYFSLCWSAKCPCPLLRINGEHNFVRRQTFNFQKKWLISNQDFSVNLETGLISQPACSGDQWTEEIAHTTPTNHVIKMSKNSGRNLLPELPCNRLKQNLNYEIYFHQPKFEILKWIIQSPLKFKKNDFVQFLSHFCKEVLFVNSLDKV